MLHDPIEIKTSEVEEKKSVEIPNTNGARKSKLAKTGDTIIFSYEDLKTTWDALIKGHKLSENGQCFGWRNFKSNYSWITYGEFKKRAENFGSGLVKIGLNPCPSSRIGIYSQNRIEWVVAQYGVWSKSSVVVPLYDTLGPEAYTFILKQTDIKIVICDDDKKIRNLIRKKNELPCLQHIITMNDVDQELYKLTCDKGIKLYSFEKIENLGKKYSTPVLPPQSSDVALICYTSGTTGVPKGAMLTHDNFIAVSCATNLLLGNCAVTKQDTMVSYMPLAHVFELFMHVLFLMVGGRIGFFSGNVNYLLDDVRILQPTVIAAVPRLLNKWYDKAQILNRNYLETHSSGENSTIKFDAKSACKPFIDTLGGQLRLIATGAAPIYTKVLEFYTETVGCKVCELYGTTETSGPIAGVLLDSDYDGCAGAPIPCCTIRLADVPEMGYFSKNSQGEVCIKGQNVFKGYLKNPAKTAEALDEDGWLYSGDIGMWLPNGTLKIIDRKKSILKLSQGEYVAPEKIENIYGLSPFVSQIFVHAESLKSFLVAIVVPDKEVVLPWCKENLKCESWSEICSYPAVNKLILEDMLRIGKEAGLNSLEQVKAIHLHPEVLTNEAGFLTPTLKMKREFCNKYFAEQIETLYSKVKECV